MYCAEPIVVITGASSGIGKAIGERLQDMSLQVVNISNSPSKFFDDILVDISDSKALNMELNYFLETLGEQNIHYLINNAGIMPLEQDSVSLFDRVMNTNLRSMYQISLKLLGKIDKGILNISSVSAFGPATPDDPIAYGLSKAGVITLTKYLAVKNPNLCVNSISPGFISPTNLCGGAPTPRELIEMIPKKREGTLQEIVDLVNYIMQQEYITGHNFVIDGGLSL